MIGGNRLMGIPFSEGKGFERIEGYLQNPS
jgi:hypothetical protein